ncbi:MAG: DNA repair protein RadA [Nitrospirae bacterium]|nr:DNA repair protein RadA [Nitrospirota bacterium]
MAAKTRFVCQSCGGVAIKWAGRCPACGEWHTLVEELVTPGPHRAALVGGGGARPEPVTRISAHPEPRVPTGIGELDRVLGGGVVAGAVVLVGGDPGIGKSTLMLQACNQLAARGPVLYVSGEEAPHQVRMRAERLHAGSDNLLVLAETQLEAILARLDETRPVALVVDSIQTTHTAELPSAPGSVAQVREVAARLIAVAKTRGLPTFLVGHVTKEGAIAGPRVLEHMVDTVLYFEGDRGHAYRVLRAVKNRFGTTNEIGVFEMKAAGLCGVGNPSALFLAERPTGASGSVVTATITGTRPILVELQALVSPAAFGNARRTALGVDGNRLGLLLAVMEKRAGRALATEDVYVNVVGGIRIDDPAVDLGLVVAVASSHREAPVDPETLVLGEVGLAGEVRTVQQMEARIKEARSLGFSRFVVPARGAAKLHGKGIVGVETISAALAEVFR